MKSDYLHLWQKTKNSDNSKIYTYNHYCRIYLKYTTYLVSPFCFCIIALTFNGRPNNVIKPSASWWSYKSPVVNEARLSEYNEYGEVVPALIMFPL